MYKELQIEGEDAFIMRGNFVYEGYSGEFDLCWSKDLQKS
jgi:hypothetical protein